MVHSDCGGKCIRHNHAPDCAADPENWRTLCLSASPMRDASRKDADSCSNAAPRIFETAAAGIRRGLIKLRSQCPSTQNFLCGATAPHPAWDEFTLSAAVHTWKTHRIWATCLGDPGPLAADHGAPRDPPCGGLRFPSVSLAYDKGSDVTHTLTGARGSSEVGHVATGTSQFNIN